VNFDQLKDNTEHYKNIDWGEVDYKDFKNPKAYDSIDWGKVQWSELDWEGKGSDSTIIKWDQINWDEIALDDLTVRNSIEWKNVNLKDKADIALIGQKTGMSLIELSAL